MAELATLPVFFKLAGKRAVLAGGLDAALWKAELLAAAGSHVEIYAADISPAFEALAASQTSVRVTLTRRAWSPADLEGAAIAIGAAASDNEAAAFASAARAAGVPVNVIDRPEYCDFQFGAIVNRSPLIVAISTDGGAPVFAQSIRSAIEGFLPLGLKRWAEAAKSWRRLGDRLGATMSERRRFWERFTDLAFANADRAPTEDDVALLLAPRAAETPGPTGPQVTIVRLDETGVDNLTLGAVRALRTADHIFCDGGVPPAISDFARREASRSRLGSGEKAGDATIGEIVAVTHSRRRVVLVVFPDAAENLSTALKSSGLAVVTIRSGHTQ